MNNDIKRLLLWLFAGLIVIGSILLIIFTADPRPTNDPEGPASQQLIDEINADDWKKGAADGKVTLVEYSDFQCPACGYWYSQIEDLVDEFGGDLTFVYRHLPLKSIHANASVAAEASEAAGLQGKFWEMHGIIFENQKTWSLLSRNDFKSQLSVYAGEIGLDVAKFEEDLSSDAVTDAVDDDLESANRTGVSSTPTFFLNGKRVAPNSPEEFRDMILQALDGTADNAS